MQIEQELASSIWADYWYSRYQAFLFQSSEGYQTYLNRFNFNFEMANGNMYLTLVPKEYSEIKIAGTPASKHIKKLLQFTITTTAVAVVMIVIAAIMLNDPNFIVRTLGMLSVGHCFFVGIPVSISLILKWISYDWKMLALFYMLCCYS